MENNKSNEGAIIKIVVPLFIMALGIFLIVATEVEGRMQFIPAIFILLGLAELIRSFARKEHKLTKKQQSDINQKSGHLTYLFIITATLASVVMLIMNILSIEMVLHLHLTLVILVYPLLQIFFLVRES